MDTIEGFSHWLTIPEHLGTLAVLCEVNGEADGAEMLIQLREAMREQGTITAAQADIVIRQIMWVREWVQRKAEEGGRVHGN